MARLAIIMVVTGILAIPQLFGQGRPKIKVDPKQKVVTMAMGAGIPDLIHGAVRYKVTRRNRAGACAGYIPLGEMGNLISAGVDHFFYLGRSKRLVWYSRQGINYLIDERNSKTDSYAYLTLALGRDFTLIRPYGFSIDMGVIFKFHDEKTQDKTESWLGLDYNIPVLPAIRVQGLFGM